MDHWGDPWADNANDKSPTKKAVTSPLPPASSFAPVPLNGFVDDARWGDTDDDGFGDWATSDTAHVALTDVVSTRTEDAGLGSAGWAAATYGDREDLSVKWPGPLSVTPQDHEKVDSEPSDSSTVSQLDDAVSQATVEEPSRPEIDVESSVRSSTSPSETSRNDLPIESPRSSFEEEHVVQKDNAESEPSTVGASLDTAVVEFSPGAVKEETNKDVDNPETSQGGGGPTTDPGDVDDTASSSSDSQSVSHVSEDSEATADDAAAATMVQPKPLSSTFVCNTALLAQLFPCSEEPDKQLDEHEDPIFSTSARKAWYRLTRKQTMREFNHGDNDDNYIRVTWSNSHVRAEVHKVVSRWAREDRISGTGPGARASFYWDTPAPAESKASMGHLRTQSSVPTTKTALPARQSLPPLDPNPSAPFNWSSSVSEDPWKTDNPAQRTIPTSLAPKNPTVAKLQRQEGRPVSVDLTPRKSEQMTHKRTATVSHQAPKTTDAAPAISPPTTQPTAKSVDSWASFEDFNKPATPTIDAADTSVNDDDDWGEMVQTPTMPTPQQLDPFPHPSEPNITPPPPPVPAQSSSNATPVEAVSMEQMSAAPIVRLQSTISPTSALFKANSFVPLNAEQGLIGPGILKPANRAVRSTPGTKIEANALKEASVENLNIVTRPHTSKEQGTGDKSHLGTKPDSPQSPVESMEAVRTSAQPSSSTSVAQSATPTEVSTDSWADADFSFFESAVPATTQPSSQAQDSSDPFSVFEAPFPTSTPPASSPFSRSPSRNPTPPIAQPLTNTASSLQRRKAEEDKIIDDILNGLPDLSYMFRH